MKDSWSVEDFEFSSKFVHWFDRVVTQGETLVITKGGKPVAKIVPAYLDDASKGLRGSAKITGDIVATVWEP